jgi:hypothetical protein
MQQQGVKEEGGAERAGVMGALLTYCKGLLSLWRS